MGSIVHFFHLTGRVANLLIILTVHNGVKTEVYRYSNLKVASSLSNDGCPFNSISVISRRWEGERERLCAMKRRLGSGRISPPAGFEPATP